MTKRKSVIRKSQEVALASTRPAITIIDAISDPDIFGKWFKDRESFAAWVCLLKAIFGLPLDAIELELFQRLTGRTAPAPLGYLVVALVIGRRGGKSLFLALVAAFLATFYDWTPFLNDSEKGTVVIVASDKKQGRAIFRFLSGMLKIPLLAGRITRETADSIELSNGISVEIMAANFRTVRGYTVVAALADELAFWSSDETGANPDVEIINAIRPAMATVPSAMLLMASSPYAKRGVLWDTFKRHFGQDDSATLVVQADTRTMNPSVSESFIADAYEADPANAAAEYGGLFRSDVSSFMDLELVEAAVDQGVVVRPRRDGVAYHSGIDPSGGQRDSFCAAVSHNENGIAVLDCLLEIKAPFNSADATARVSEMRRAYGLSSTTSDRYGSGWVVDAFAKYGIKIRHSDRDRSTIYLDCLPLFTAGKVRLLDHPRLVRQFAQLERKTSATGRDQVTHPPGSHQDDACNAAALALVLASAVKRPMSFTMPFSASAPNYFRSFESGARIPSGAFDLGGSDQTSMPPGGWPREN
jgi:hypothetical protein